MGHLNGAGLALRAGLGPQTLSSSTGPGEKRPGIPRGGGLGLPWDQAMVFGFFRLNKVFIIKLDIYWLDLLIQSSRGADQVASQ